MKIVFSNHAVSQIRERKISKEFILITVQSPQKVIPSFRSRMLHQRRFGDKILEVVTREEDDKIVIITQYWLKG